MYYVYLLKSTDGKRYIGFTSDLRRRLKEHNTNSGNYTRGRKWKLVYYEAYLSKKDALRREKALKDGRARYQLFNRIEDSLKEV